MKKIPNIAVASVFLWVGFVLAISFMEAWLKFKAPNVTLPIGLGIGKIVFSSLNKMEWFFAAAIYFNMAAGRTLQKVLFALPLTILFFQTVYLLPALNLQADAIIAGEPFPPSQIHIYYIILEALKVALLLPLGFLLLKPTLKAAIT